MAQGGGKPSFIVLKWVEINETKLIAENKSKLALRYSMGWLGQTSLLGVGKRNKKKCRKLLFREVQALNDSFGACLQCEREGEEEGIQYPSLGGVSLLF
jgi:hypothetical protein